MKSIQEKIEIDFAAALSSLLKGYSAPFKIITALSGGPDSTALLLLLSRFQKEFSFDLAAVYINHGIRSLRECRDEETQVVSLCQPLGIPLFIKHYDPGFLEFFSSSKGCGLEAAARTYRYHYFEKLALAAELPVLYALGHNRNDQVETVLMRLFAGSSIEGLKGIPVKRENYIRPLLEIERKDIEQYLKDRNIMAVIDKSNLKTDFLRNKIRLDLLKNISQTFPAVEDSVLNFNRDLKNILDHYSGLLEQSCPWVISPGQDALSCRLQNFEQIPFVSRKRMILEQMNRLQKGLYSPSRRIPSSFFTPLADMSHNVILKGHGIILERKGDDLVLELLQNDREAGDEISVFYLDRTHSFEQKAYTVQLTWVSEVEKEDYILYLFSEHDSTEPILIRTALAKSELKPFSVGNQRARLILFYKNKALCALNTERVFLPIGGKFKKINNYDSKNNAQCVIIRFRGHYAPG